MSSRTSRFVLLLATLAPVVGCDRKPSPPAGPAGPACLTLPLAPSGSDTPHGFNPLLAGRPLCFDTAASCARARDNLPAGPACEPIDRPSWHCHHLPTASGDPFAGSSACYPTPALCQRSLDAALRSSDSGSATAQARDRTCTPSASAFCTLRASQLTCYPHRASCETTEKLTASLLGEQPAPCEPAPG